MTTQSRRVTPTWLSAIALMAVLAACAACMGAAVPTATTVPPEPPTPVAAPLTRVDGRTIDDLYTPLRPTGQVKESPREIMAEVFRDAIPPDTILPVYRPAAIPAAEATFLRDDELVMGVEVGGQARAYPVGLMRIREMVNDELGGVPILVTW